MDTSNATRHQVFVSYSRKDSDWADAFRKTPKRRRWSVFLDTRSIRPGDEWSEEIDVAIDAAKVVVVLWSASSVRSSHVVAEAARAAVRGTLVPLSIERTVAIPPAFRRFQTRPMHVAGATILPPDLVATIAMRIAAAEPPTASAEEQRLRDDLMLTSTLARDRGVPMLAMQAQLKRLGGDAVAPEDIPAQLESFVSEFLELKANLSRAANADPDVAPIQSRSLELLNAGDLSGAWEDSAHSLIAQLAHIVGKWDALGTRSASIICGESRMDAQSRYARDLVGIAPKCKSLSLKIFGQTANTAE